ncbi:MAG TPA: DUF2637 domain-containing protein [Micromonosporaceae bacterium]
MNARKATSVAGVVAVAMVAAAISYDHQQHLAVTHGQPAVLAAIWPLCTDGMIASCAAVVAQDRAGGYRPRTWAVSGFWLGVAVSILTNWLATSGGLVAHGVSAFPALAFLITIEALSSRPRPRKAAILPAKPQATPPIKAAKPPVRKAATKATKAATIAASKPNLSTTEIAKLAGVSARTARRAVNGHDVLEAVK